MFLRHLTDEQQLAFLALALKTIQSDGHTDPREEQLILAMRLEMNLLQATRLPQGDLETLVRLFPDKKSRGIVMLELLGLIYADDRFHKQEQKLLRGLARLFGYDEVEANRYEYWVLRHIDMLKEAQQLMS